MRPLFPVAALARNSIKRVTFADRPAVAVCNVDGQFFALDDLCSHGKGFLSRGTLENGAIVCPVHLGAFDPATGAPTLAPCVRPVATYRMAVIDQVLYLLDAEA
jgi:nitrite reductase/ring-hydroxylating ferredoxin subunit